MDYDDNDFQSQGFHLGSEDSTKFPPLRSLAPTKFDLDEHLQVHFDSIGDTGVLRGIQNQEENNWIEYFSQTSGIEFGSNTAESCSISRRNNVWFEATSTESVEMLLTSVGQDGSIAKQNIIEESNVCDGLDSLNNQMEPTLNQDDSVPSKIRGTLDTQPTLPPEKSPQRPLTSSKYSAEDHPYVEVLSLTPKDDKSGYKKLIDSGLSSVDNKFDSYVFVSSEHCSLKQNTQTNGGDCAGHAVKSGSDNLENCCSSAAKPGSLVKISVSHNVSSEKQGELFKIDAHQMDCSVLCKESELGDQPAGSIPQEPSSVATEVDVDRWNLDRVSFESMQVGPSATCMQDLVVGATDGCSEVVSCDDLEGLIEGVSQNGNIPVLGQDTQAKDRHCVGHDAESGTDNLQEPSSIATEGDEDRGDLDRVAFERVQVGLYVQDLVVGATDECSEVVSCDNPEGLTGCVSQKGNRHILRQDTQADDRHCVEHAAESGTDNLEDHISILKPCSLVQITLSHEAVVSDKEGEMLNMDANPMDCRVLSKGCVTSDQTEGSLLQEGSSVATESDKDLEGHYFEKGNDLMENPLTPMVMMGTLGQMKGLNDLACCKKPEYLLNDDGHQVESGFSNKGTESDVQIRERNLGTSSSIIEEKIEGEFVESINNDAGNLSSSVVMVSSPTDTTHEKQEMAGIKGGIDSSTVEGMNVISHNPQLMIMEKKMLDKMVESDDNNQDVTSNVSGVNNSIRGVSAELHISSFKDANLSQTCDNRSMDGGSGDGHMVQSDSPSLEKENTQPSTHLDTMEGSCLVIEKQVDASSSVQSTSSVHAEVFESSTQHGIVYESVPGEVVSQDATQLASLKKLDQTSLVADEVVEQKEDGKPPLPGSNFIDLDKLDTVNKISTQLCSSVQENSVSHASSGSICVLESGRHNVCNAAAEMVAERTIQSTAAGNSLDISKASICIEAAQEFDKEQKTQAGARSHSSVTNQSTPEVPRVSFDKCGAASIVVTGGLLNICNKSSLTPITSSDNIAELHTLADECGNPNSSEPKCGSPTVSCSEPSQTEKKFHGSSDENIPISDDAHQIDRKVDAVNFTAQDTKGKAASEEDRSFTFIVGSPAILPDGESGERWRKFPNIQGFGLPQTTKESPTMPGPCQTDPEMLQETPHGRRQVSGDRKAYGTIKNIGGDKTGLVSGSAGDRTVAAGRKRAKETHHPKQITENVGSPCSASVNSDGTTSMPMRAEETAKYSCIEGNNTTACCVPTVQPSSLPDLNTSASPMKMFHQPFTILQQVQLRAQIFVYGSLIQGTAPDEACMISAFGDTSQDIGRSAWENAWRVAVERFNNQKSPQNNLETPLHSYSGARVARCNSLQTVAVSLSASKGAASAIGNPSMSLSSPVRNFSTPRDGLPSSSMSRGSLHDSHQLLSPLHAYPSLHMRPHTVNTTPLQSEVPGLGSSWVVSPQTSALDTSKRYSTLPIAEAVKVTSVRDLSEPSASSAQLVFPIPLAPTGGPADVPTSANLLIEEKRKTPRKHASTDQKPGKRKRSVMPDGQISSMTQPRIEPDSSTGAIKHSATSECILSPSPPTSAGTSGGLACTSSPIVSSRHHHIVGSGNTDQRVIFSEETCSRIELAKHASTDQKPKKRKKSVVLEHRQISSVTKPQNDPASSTGATKYSATSECILSPAPPTSVATSGGLASSSSPIASSMHYHIVGSANTDKRVIFSEETSSRIEQAKLHAEDAAALADSAVRHSQGIWNQLASKKNSGLVSDVEAKLASAAVAAAAAASVAKAAAAAAKVASDAALQAKLMVDEALIMPKQGNCAQDTGVGLLDSRMNLERISPASIIKGKDRTKSSSSLFAASREAARRRVEVASAAAKRAKNLDAVVKAAELAAEAVSHAGTVISMGDPIPFTLTELVEAGPEGYWKAQQNSTERPVNINGLHVSEQLSPVAAVECPGNAVEHLRELPSSKNEAQRSAVEGKMNNTTKDLIKDSVENKIELVSSLQDGFEGQGQKMSDVAKTVGEVSEAEVGLRPPSLTAQNDRDERHQPLRTSKEIDIKEGSLVEVVSDEDGLRGVWFAAKVLSLKDGNAYVCYTDLLQDEGRGQLKEWIPLETEGDKAPRIRIAHPMTAMKFEGTRKRRRAAMGNYAWSVGDRVDAWMRDGWWEGVVIERSDSDETKLTIHFPADGDSSIIRAWNLRPSLIWKDGQWMEWSREKNCFPHEVDTPEEKRQKLGRHEIEIDSRVVAGGNNQSKILCIEDSIESEESRPNKKFTVTRNLIEENISDALKMKRTGLQMEGSRVVFGIPKPGKKRKFMNVSKHYIADGVTKTSEGTDSVKFAKYLVPQGSIGWKSTSNYIKGKKRPANSKPKMLNSGKDQSIPSRSKPEQNGCSISVVAASSGSNEQDTLLNVKASVGHKENYLEKSTHLESHSFSNTFKAAEDLVLLSPQELDSGVQSFKKPSSSGKEEGGMKGKAAVAGRKLASDEKGSGVPGKQIEDAIEPRRSNRRIQPTSRLLEGLQSSFIISKIPSLSHGRSAKTQHRNTSSSRGNTYA